MLLRLKQISGILTYDEITSLISISDTFISLHRSEGLGRGGAEAILLGKNAVITGYSGVEDYIEHPLAKAVKFKLVECRPGDYPHCEGQKWADPDIGNAVNILKTIIIEKEIIGERINESPKTITNLGVGESVLKALENITQKQNDR